METTHCLADAKHIRHFLDACDGNWHRCIYVECANCRAKNPCNHSGFLFCPDYRAVPLILPLSDADILFACRPEPGEIYLEVQKIIEGEETNIVPRQCSIYKRYEEGKDEPRYLVSLNVFDRLLTTTLIFEFVGEYL